MRSSRRLVKAWKEAQATTGALSSRLHTHARQFLSGSLENLKAHTRAGPPTAWANIHAFKPAAKTMPKNTTTHLPAGLRAAWSAARFCPSAAAARTTAGPSNRGAEGDTTARHRDVRTGDKASRRAGTPVRKHKSRQHRVIATSVATISSKQPSLTSLACIRMRHCSRKWRRKVASRSCRPISRLRRGEEGAGRQQTKG